MNQKVKIGQVWEMKLSGKKNTIISIEGDRVFFSHGWEHLAVLTNPNIYILCLDDRSRLERIIDEL